jgi:hypothetical protein
MKNELCPRKARLLNASEQANTAYPQAVAAMEQNLEMLIQLEYDAALHNGGGIAHQSSDGTRATPAAHRTTLVFRYGKIDGFTIYTHRTHRAVSS